MSDLIKPGSAEFDAGLAAVTGKKDLHDPAADLRRKLAGRTLPRPTGYNILVALYIRPEKSKGGVYFADKTRDEDKWQGRVGLVLALGPQAYEGDGVRSFPEPWCREGDWVVFPSLEHINAKFDYGDTTERVTLALVPDDRVIARVDDPAQVQ